MSTKELFPAAWLTNTLLDDAFVASKLRELGQKAVPYLYRLPVSQPSDAEIKANPDYTTLTKNALLLTLAANWDDFADLALLFSLHQQDVPTTPKAMDLLRAENDKIVARLYGIDDAELTHLLKSFKGMATKRPEYLALLQSI